MDGILLVNKPVGWTSHDVVAKVRNILKNETGQKAKVGHTGTLDPMANGLLVLVVGSYTKRAQEFSKLDKVYEVTMTLGKTSSTGDKEGEITQFSDKIPSQTEVGGAIKSFVGEIMQTPPAFSAIKIDGKRAYKLAREGKKVKMKQRRLTIYDISKIEYNYPNISFVVKVSSGTYIRSLVEDVGGKLGTGAYLLSLKRTEVGKFRLGKAHEIKNIAIDKLLTN
jgi:tRNA pseudouridine55 synthase